MTTREDKEYFINLWRQCTLTNCGCGTYVYAIIAFIVILALSSCATKTRIEYRDRDVNHYITNVVHDTLIDKTTDSVFYEVKVKGDTVFSTKYKERTRWRDRIVEKHDTCFRDSIVTVKKETTVEVVKIPKIYRISLLFSILVIIFAIIKALRWVRTR
jgi:hypothetical protein